MVILSFAIENLIGFILILNINNPITAFVASTALGTFYLFLMSID